MGNARDRWMDGWMDEDAGNTHVIDDREMTYMGNIGETGPYQSTIIA